MPSVFISTNIVLLGKSLCAILSTVKRRFLFTEMLKKETWMI